MKISLVTGGAGFIGSHLVKRLIKENEKVIVIDNLFRGKLSNLKSINSKKLIFFKKDIASFNSFNFLKKILINYKPSKIFHYAAINGTEHFYKNPIITQKTNSLATLILTSAIDEIYGKQKNKPLLIFASTSENYGNPKSVPTKETDLTYVNLESVRDSYSSAKLMSEFYVKYGSLNKNYNYLILRIFNVYGPNMVDNEYGQVIPEFIKRLGLGEYPLKIKGTGNQTRSFCYIDDHIEITLRLIKKKHKNLIINIGSPDEIKISDLAKLIMIKMKMKPKILRTPNRMFEVSRRSPNIKKLIKLIGPYNFIKLSKGLDKLI